MYAFSSGLILISTVLKLKLLISALRRLKIISASNGFLDIESTFILEVKPLSVLDNLFTHLENSAGYLSARLTSFDAATQVPDALISINEGSFLTGELLSRCCKILTLSL